MVAVRTYWYGGGHETRRKGGADVRAHGAGLFSLDFFSGGAELAFYLSYSSLDGDPRLLFSQSTTTAHHSAALRILFVAETLFQFCSLAGKHYLAEKHDRA